MEIRKTQVEEIETVMRLYGRARAFMRATGNKNQWINGYPSRETVLQDIGRGDSYVCVEDDGEITGVFCFRQGTEPGYRLIEQGEWLNDEPYGVIHRLASSGKRKRLGDECIRWCFSRCPNLRVDTHRDNRVMQNVLERNGFRRCGIIYVEDGTPRIAYQGDRSSGSFQPFPSESDCD